MPDPKSITDRRSLADSWMSGKGMRRVNGQSRRRHATAFFGGLVLLGASIGTWFTPASGSSAFQLDLPIACEPGGTCWIVLYVDHDPGAGVRDFACGTRTKDRHEATNFMIRDLAAMNAGVEVLAAASGVVKAVRDGMDDKGTDKIGRAELKGKECGNGVVVDHQDEWQTQYCHLRRGSVAVK